MGVSLFWGNFSGQSWRLLLLGVAPVLGVSWWLGVKDMYDMRDSNPNPTRLLTVPLSHLVEQIKTLINNPTSSLKNHYCKAHPTRY